MRLQIFSACSVEVVKLYIFIAQIGHIGTSVTITRLSNRKHLQMHAAVNASEQDAVEKTMLEDKLKATDWEATNEAIEEQVRNSLTLVVR